MYHFSEQLWKTSGNKLINKKLQVQNKPQSDNEWNLPISGGDGYLEDITSGNVTSLKQKKNCEYGVKAELMKRDLKQYDHCSLDIDSKRWLRSADNKNGWFTLKNLANGELLTAKRKNEYKTTGELRTKIFIEFDLASI